MLAGVLFVHFVCMASQHWIGVAPRVVVWQASEPADRIRLGVRDEGVYRVTADELAQASGVSVEEVEIALVKCGVSLSCQGRTVAWWSAGGDLYFYGVPAREFFAPENVYWLTLGSGTPMEAVDAAPDSGEATNAWFTYEEHYRRSFVEAYDWRDRRSSHGTLTNVLNFGEWIPASADEATRMQCRTLEMPGYSEDASACVTVRTDLVSYRDFVEPDTHTCEILANGVSCGSQVWSNEQAVTFDYAVPPGTITNASVWLGVRNAGGTTTPYDFMVLDVTLLYPRAYSAHDGVLLCAGGAAGSISADGFPDGQIAVWDVTEPVRASVLAGNIVAGTNGLWQAHFACGGAASRYAVFAVPSGAYAPSVCGVRDVAWNDPREMPELAIVIPPRRWVSGFAEAVQPLADFRTAQGMRTRVIDAEAIYNGFSGGLVHPEAFRRFCAAGVTNAVGQTLRYLLFAGYGGSDYKLDAIPLERSKPYTTLLPIYLISRVEVSSATTGALLLPSDLELGNAVGGAVPEVAVGRFIANNAAELSCMVSKTIRYELTETWKKKAVFAADWQNTGTLYGNFPGIATTTAAGFPSIGWTLNEFYPADDQRNLGPLWMNTYYRTGVYYELQEGAGFFYYVGHSGDMLVGHSTADKLCDAAMLRAGSWPFAPVAVLMGCRMGRWTALDLMTQLQCVAEAGVRNAQSGFTAVISASGYMTTDEATAFSYAFSDQVAAGAVRLGDALCGTLGALGDEVTTELHHLTLLGDPSLCIRVDETACGTPTAWLIAHGLTGDPYADLLDQDADGFQTWQEVKAGTRFDQRGLRLSSLRLPDTAGASMSSFQKQKTANAPCVVLSFETVAGLNCRILSTTSLADGGVWQPLPWRLVGSAEWSLLPINGDWPLKKVEVPYTSGNSRVFYKVVGE